MKKKKSFEKACGFSLIEILISASLLIAVSLVVFSVFRSFDEAAALDKDASNIISVLERARKETLFSKNSLSYGVRFNADEIIFFEGEFFDGANPDNISVKLHPKIFISDISLTNATTSLSFKRLSGEAGGSGTITLQSRANSFKTRVISIEETGLVK